MKTHPYLRAYMAGVLLPSWVLLLVLAIFLLSHFSQRVPAGLEGAIVFPMAVVPNLWGAWNILYLAIRSRLRWSLGVHGAVLPLVLMPLGVALARSLDVFELNWELVLPMVPVGMTVYYLAWKYLVGFLNQEVGIA